MYLSDLLGSRIVDGDGRRAGRVRDMVIRLAGNGTGPVIGLVTRRHGQDLFISMERVARLAAGGVALRSASVAPEVFARREAEALLGRDVMDREVIDVSGTRLVRVTEVVLDKADDAWHVAGVTTGLSAVMRRLLPRALRNSRRAGKLLSWDNLDGTIWSCWPARCLAAVSPPIIGVWPASIPATSPGSPTPCRRVKPRKSSPRSTTTWPPTRWRR